MRGRAGRLSSRAASPTTDGQVSPIPEPVRAQDRQFSK
ncbi:hypothetical protein D779_1296 [Imhoffiella purpurea]|uniref:Uncharacterized protein n=1 Tax=Imhoffiella purpurea TaxID=1249627 RepID=W9V802_9GAMM|nr:hypothetical protein D779_1296 [Imhoffiella purpurea]